MKPVVTRAVAGSVKRVSGTAHVNLTHAVRVDADGKPLRVVCDRVELGHVLDDECATDEDAPPTCPTCAKKDPRRGVFLATMKRLRSEMDAVHRILSLAEHTSLSVAHAWDEDSDPSLTEDEAALAEAFSVALGILREQVSHITVIAESLHDEDPQALVSQRAHDALRDAIDGGKLFELSRKLGHSN